MIYYNIHRQFHIIRGSLVGLYDGNRLVPVVSGSLVEIGQANVQPHVNNYIERSYRFLIVVTTSVLRRTTKAKIIVM